MFPVARMEGGASGMVHALASLRIQAEHSCSKSCFLEQVWYDCRVEGGCMSTFVYKPRGVCSTEIRLDIKDSRIEKLEVKNGCNGNLKGIAALVQGQDVDDVIGRLEGIRCGFKPTSCPDQIAQALKAFKQQA